MVRVGAALQSLPPKFPHQCPKCKRKELSEKQYPYMEYEEKPDLATFDGKEFEQKVIRIISRQNMRLR